MQSDLGTVHVTNFHGSGALSGDGYNASGSVDGDSEAGTDIRLLAKEFVTQFRIHHEFLYMDMLRSNLSAGLHYVEFQMLHLQQFSGVLFGAVQHNPTRALPLMEHAVWELAQERKLFPAYSRETTIQVQLFWGVPPMALRNLAQAAVAQLVSVSGIVVKSSSTHARCVRAAIQCTSCRSKAYINGGRSIDLPPQCMENSGRGGVGGGGGTSSGKCRPNPYVLLPMECEYEDQQIIKLQELPEDVPTGELPRHLTVVVDRYLVDRISPGSRVQIVGVVSVQEKRGGFDSARGGGRGRAAAGLRAQYLRCVGLMFRTTQDANCAVVSVNQNFSSRVRSRSTMTWQPEEEASFKAFAKQGGVFQKLSASIDPAIFGLEDQKKAIVCLLFGGTRKRIGSNFLRGDMNVLFIGDPSTAKSQLLKFVEKVAPIGIYTSGKGSSAAGLTASVISNGNGDFVLEAGSMVLADGGVVCIDEFDKMREQDQVAIHEAMEQQTISIAKANMTTMLNSRTSVLAAANPTLGSYDPLRSNEDQMDFQSSILSRFDLIFKVIDPRNPETDQRLAHHVISLHKSANGSGGRRGGGRAGASASAGSGAATSAAQSSHGEVVERCFFTKYISYARATCRPVISEEAMKVLLDFYVQVRRDAHQQTLATIGGTSGGNGSAAGGGGSSSNKTPIIQITARQLESLVRITESMARMRLDVLASRSDAEEAIKLFKIATVDAIKSGVADQILTEAQSELVLRVEEALRRRVALGATVEHHRLLSELARMGFDSKLVERALYAMVKREELEWRKQRTLLHRVR
ncbi:putative minchromosome maintenance (MCM) complex subunit [Leishmania major strain Friedlin]|uniref:DNA replication licensing factor MCM5 n=1 Tax=Leishmania major TaxID=5664 RepID=Q4QAP2_LEIMA|nr:putative minchromosome maintenance (MCM) complex subunit [Leishmania major strain Friedlin]CAG9574558.1 DNA_replication_licensing_factor_MCM5_-_putative [Leishmania major strain Friedlin]CAJ04564.1 putative minchromosome maintenance (MCM) complex subunit [Leishmania major strain Friedlin]|eukprot:XP_001683606.1 putative minchromosome maintenance (MCM) complex subunit [Leishmania major strain Friedlin]